MKSTIANATRTTRRLAASIAIITALATSGAWAGTFKWTGVTDNYWNTTSNWDKSGSYGSRTLPTNDDMLFNSSDYNSRFTENEVIFNGAYTNSYRCYINNVGTADDPLVFRATDAAYGMQFSSNGDTTIANTADAYLRLESGTWSVAGTKNLPIGTTSYKGQLTLTDGASLSVDANVYINHSGGKLVVDNGARLYLGQWLCLRAGEMTVENGTVELGTAKTFEVGQYSAASIFLNEGGVLITRNITKKTYGGTVLFNGGTLRSNLDNATLISDDSGITVKVGTRGGTIDANTFAVSFPRPIAVDGENDGGMTFKGGGSVTLEYANSYTGATKIAVRTKLVVTSAELTRLLANGGITVIKPEGVSSKGTFKLLSKSDGDCTAAEYALITKGAGLEGATFDIDGDGDITVTVSHTPQTWAGAAETTATWSGANWDTGVVFDDGNDAVFATDGAIAEVDNDYSAYTLTFNENASLTGSGTLTSPTITVADGKVASIAGPVAGAVEKLGAGTLTLGSSRAGTTTTLTEGTLVANAPVGTLVLGTDATKPVTFDYGGQTYSPSFTLNDGLDVTLTNCTFSSFSRVANGTVHVAKDATAYINNWITLGPTSDRSDTAALLDICGGTVSNATRNIGLGDRGLLGSSSEVRVRNGGLFATTHGILLGSRAAATLTIDDGTVVAATDIVFCNGSEVVVGEDCFLNLNAGGLLSARSITYGSGAANATFTFNGGTLKANQDYTLIQNKPKLSVVTATSGTIDADGHAVTIDKAISGAGGMAYQGGGEVTFNVQPTYTGVTTVEVGTMLVVPSAIAGDKLAFTVPDGLADGAYAVVSISGGSQFPDSVLEGRPAGFVLSSDKKTVCYLQGVDTSKAIYIGPVNGSLSVASNWLDGVVPTGGIGDAIVFWPAPATLAVGDTFRPASIAIPSMSALITIGTGTLCADAVENQHLLSVAAGATVVIGNMTLAKGKCICDRNNGTMVVSNLLMKAESGDRYATENQEASVPGVFKFNSVTNSMSDNYFYLADHHTVGTNEFYVGNGGLNFLDAENSAAYCLGRNSSGNVTTIRPWYSDFTIADRGDGKCGLVLMRNVTFCTDDEGGIGRTITIDAITRGYRTPQITVSGTGTLHVNNGNVNSEQPPVTVTDTATLAFAEGASLGTGAITLGAGTTLVLSSNSDRTFTTPPNDLVPPAGENETATLRIDGNAPLRSGEYILFNSVPTGCADHLTVTGTALGKCKTELFVDDGKLKMTVVSPGFVIIVK